MKKKQLLGILLAGTMMVGAAVPVFAADGDRVKITYAQWGNETETAATQAVADKFNSEQDKIEVEVVKIDHDTYVTKLNAMATAGELPDTGIMSEAGVLNFAENGLLADISSMYGEGDAKPLELSDIPLRRHTSCIFCSKRSSEPLVQQRSSERGL